MTFSVSLGQAACFGALMWELGYLACLSLNVRRQREAVPLTRWERFILSPFAVLGLTAQTLMLAGVITHLVLRS